MQWKTISPSVTYLAFFFHLPIWRQSASWLKKIELSNHHIKDYINTAYLTLMWVYLRFSLSLSHGGSGFYLVIFFSVRQSCCYSAEDLLLTLEWLGAQLSEEGRVCVSSAKWTSEWIGKQVTCVGILVKF